MKNHIKVGDKLLQTNKSFSDLKEKQKNIINDWFYAEYKACRNAMGSISQKGNDKMTILAVKKKTEEAQIWISEGELSKYFFAHKNKFEKRYIKEFETMGIHIHGDE